MTELTSSTLPIAIRKLFELNNYEVDGPVQIHGAEIDLVARPKSDPFASPVYIEATVEYVDNEKYGKDVGKLALIGEVERDARRLIVSSSGFSLPVRERAEASRITTLTYDELFRKFERFEPYCSAFSAGTDSGRELSELSGIYEEPFFEDKLGRDQATQYLNRWRDSSDAKNRWLLVTGEYGTGKTALTKVLQYRWLLDYKANPALPIPFRIELRDFTRQFDARGLLHHFLDHNNLSHVPIDFVMSLIGQGRVVLLLDGYDEMAQYLHARERRTCLEALAELAAGGARGVLTSRPNYFTEAEELRVFEILYASIKHGQYYLTPEGWRFSHNSLREFLVAEHLLDGLVSGEVVDEETPVSEAMRVFPASRPQDDRRSLLERLAGIWRRTDLRHGRGQLLSLLWDGLVPLFAKETDPSTACLTAVSGSPVALKGVNISRVALSTERFPAVLKGASFAESGLFQVDFSGADLEGADFSGATLEEVRFQAARLQYCKFIGAMLIDIEITGADVTNADFSALDPDYVSVVADDPDARSGRKRLQGMSALGYLHFKGAHTAPLPPSTIFQHDPRFPIVAKIVEKLAEQTVRQRRGLEQRGESRNDIPFARRFVSHLESTGLVRTGCKDLLEVTDRGREIFGRFVQTRELPDVLVEFLSEA